MHATTAEKPDRRRSKTRSAWRQRWSDETHALLDGSPAIDAGTNVANHSRVQFSRREVVLVVITGDSDHWGHSTWLSRVERPVAQEDPGVSAI